MSTAIPNSICQLGKATFDTFRRCQTAEYNQELLAELATRLLGVHQGLHALTNETCSASRLETCLQAIAQTVEKTDVCMMSEQCDNGENDALLRSVKALFPNCNDGSERISSLRVELKMHFAHLLELAPQNNRCGLEELEAQLQKMQSSANFGRLHKFRKQILEKYEAVLQECGSPLYDGPASPTPKPFSPMLQSTLEFLQTLLATENPQRISRASSSDWASTGVYVIPTEHIQIGHEIGHGAFGTVYDATWMSVPCAVKKLQIGAMDNTNRKKVMEEAERHYRLRCDHVVEMKGIALPPGETLELWIVMELMEEPLTMFVNSHYDELAPIALVDIAHQLAQGIHGLHSLYNVVHSDLKCENVLLKRDGNCISGWQAKLSDFGLSQEHRSHSMSLGDSVDNTTKGSNSVVGTYATMAPETLNGHGTSRSSDMYGFGIMLWEILHGKTAWGASLPIIIIAAVRDGRRPPFSPNPWSEQLDIELWTELCQLISRCWAQDHKDRPSFEVVIRELGEILQRMKPTACTSDPMDIDTHVGLNASAKLPAVMTAVQELRLEASRQRSGRSLSEIVKDPSRSSMSPHMRPDVCSGLLTDVLRESGDQTAKVQAADAVTFLATDAVYADAISRNGGIELLVDAVRSGSEEVIEKAVNALGNMALLLATNKVAIAEKGGIPVLIGLLSKATRTSIRESAAGCLQSLAIDPGNKKRIANEGGIEALVALLTDGTDKGKELAAGALRNLAVDPNNMVAIANAGGIGPLIQLLRNGTMECMKNAAGAIRNLAANAQNKVLIARSGGIQPLIELLRNGNEEAKEKTAGALSNLARNDHNKTLIGDAGGIETLIDVVWNGGKGSREKAAGALQNLALAPVNANRIRAAGGVEALRALARRKSDSAQRKADGALRNLGF